MEFIAEILEKFGNDTRVTALVLLLGAVVLIAVTVPLAKAYFDSEGRACPELLQANRELRQYIAEMSVLFKQYEDATQEENKLEVAWENTQAIIDGELDAEVQDTIERVAFKEYHDTANELYEKKDQLIRLMQLKTEDVKERTENEE